MSREITRADYYKAMLIYNTLINEMPADFQEQFPTIDKFLSPASWTRSFDHETIELSITGKRRFDALMGLNAKVLLMAYAAQRMDNAE